jgi:hypothetical protein
MLRTVVVKRDGGANTAWDDSGTSSPKFGALWTPANQRLSPEMELVAPCVGGDAQVLYEL